MMWTVLLNIILCLLRCDSGRGVSLKVNWAIIDHVKDILDELSINLDSGEMSDDKISKSQLFINLGRSSLESIHKTRTAKFVLKEHHTDQEDNFIDTESELKRTRCGGTSTRATGTINYPSGGVNYPDRAVCIWVINAGTPILITFTRFHVETNYDFLTIRDGSSSVSGLIATLHGNTLPSPVETSGNAAYLKFTSDYSNTYNGFKLQWAPTGCGGTFTHDTGTINYPSGGYGDNYPNNADCIWVINAGKPIQITFTRFQVETNYDFLTIRDGSSSVSGVIAKLTGHTLPPPVETSGNAANLQFTSDYSSTFSGFELHWAPSATTCQCGVPNRSKIVGGTEVNPKRKYPWQIGLVSTGFYIRCGGSIINDRWILTAAHCITDKNTCRLNAPSSLRVTVGEHHQFQTSDNDSNTKKYQIKTYIRHPNYNCKNQDYDFALLELTEAIPFNNVIQPICLPKDDTKTYVGQTGTVSGWGLTSTSGSLSVFLREVQVPILANNNCGSWGTIAAMKLCAGGQVGKDSCGGDSGGPFSVVENGKYVQVGVVSYGHKECASTSYPGIYARTSKVLSWISTTTASGKKCN